jgi:hypothetical protein
LCILQFGHEGFVQTLACVRLGTGKFVVDPACLDTNNDIVLLQGTMINYGVFCSLRMVHVVPMGAFCFHAHSTVPLGLFTPIGAT